MRKPALANLTFPRMPFPEDVIVETCAICNLRCIMCPYAFLKRPKGEMDFTIFAKIVDEVAHENPDSRFWVAIMGEPLLGKNLIPMLSYARDKGLTRINLNTNATFLTAEMTDVLLDSGIEALHISLDAATAETYDKIRKNGSFEDVIRNVERFLLEKRRKGGGTPKVIAQFIVMDENEHELEAFKEHWLGLGAIVKVRLRMGWGNAVSTKDLTEAKVERNFPCPWLLRSVSIHWDGTFSQCDADYEGIHSPGDIRTQTIKEIWDNELAKRRERTWALDFTHEPCNSCLDWSVGRATFFYPNNAEI